MILEKFTAKPSTSCNRCGEPLARLDSILMGLGPNCLKVAMRKYGVEFKYQKLIGHINDEPWYSEPQKGRFLFGGAITETQEKKIRKQLRNYYRAFDNVDHVIKGNPEAEWLST